MTVRVAAEQTFRMSKADIASYVQDVLYHDPLYRRVGEGNNGTYFSAVVQPNVPLVLGTDMTVTLGESDGATKVRVSTLSQPMAMGDLFGIYNRYITGFFGKLDEAIKAERHENMAVDQLRFVRQKGWGGTVLVIVWVVLVWTSIVLILTGVLQLSPIIAIPLILIIALILIGAGIYFNNLIHDANGNNSQ